MIHALILAMAVGGMSVAGSAERRMLADINATRSRSGLPALKLDPKLSAIAREHGIDMATHGYFDHASQNGQTPFDRMKKDRIAFGWAGENIAQSDDEPSAYRALLESPEHFRNIVQRHFQKVGIGAVVAPDGSMLFVQDFTD